jgi:hypothetical protein
MDPGLSENVNRGDLAPPAWRRVMRESAKQLEAIGTNLFGIGITLGCARG